MKLRNKKTGLVGELHYEPDKEYHFTLATEDPADMEIYRTLSELNEEWEDYKSAEPLIKDEKIRKAVRVWADVVGTDICTYDRFWETFRSMDTAISFAGVHKFELEDERNYTIAELCGEEEE